MKRQILLFCTAVALSSCGIHQIDGDDTRQPSNNGVWGGLSDGPSSETLRSVSYVTAMDYQ